MNCSCIYWRVSWENAPVSKPINSSALYILLIWCAVQCKYNAKYKVTRKELEASMKDGTMINVEDIARREAGENGGFSVV